MKRPRVGVDVDGVLACLDAIIETSFVDLYGATKPFHATWDITPVLPDGDWKRFWAHVGAQPVHDLLRPYPNAVDGLARLAAFADIYIVTSALGACRTWTADRDEWLAKHFGIDHKKVIHTNAKYTFAGAMLIDDKPAHVEAWAREHPGGTGVLFAQPYNEAHRFEEDIAARVVRTSDWNHIAELAVEASRPGRAA